MAKKKRKRRTFEQARLGFEEGTGRVDRHADREWKDRALDTVREVCVELEYFHCDRVWDAGLDSTKNDKALGPIMMKARRLGWCEKTDRVRPSIRSHLSGKPVWKSLIWRGLES